MSAWLGTIAEGKFSPLLCIMVPQISFPLPIILSYHLSCLFGSPTAASGVKKTTFGCGPRDLQKLLLKCNFKCGRREKCFHLHSNHINNM